MKAQNFIYKRGAALLVLVAISFTLTSSAPRVYANELSTRKVVISSQNFDEILFANNTDIIRAMNSVMKAKDQVQIARAAVLPSLSINLTLGMNPIGFAMNSMTCLVSFLFPGGWYDLSAAKSAASAEVMAFHITKLNVYSQAYALALQVAGDMEVLYNHEAHFARLQEYVNGLQLQVDLGVIPQTEVTRGQLELGKMQIDLSKLRQLIAEESAAIRKLFGFNLAQEFTFAMSSVPESRFETGEAVETLDSIVARAPERIQIDYLIKEAQSRVKSSYWGFLGGCQGNSGGFSTGSGGAFNVSTGLTINIGFGYYPKIKLARRSVEEMKLRQREMKLELGRVLEVSLADIHEIKFRQDQAARNMAMGEQMLKDQNHLLPLGRVSVKEMLDTYAGIAQARAEGVWAQNALDGQRVTLRRVTLEDEFLKVYIDSLRAVELETKVGRHGR